MGRGVSESRDSNSVREYMSTRARHVPTYRRTDVLNLLLWSWELYLKDHYPYLNSSYFIVNLRIQRSYSIRQILHQSEVSLSCIPTYLAHYQHQPKVSPLGVIIYSLPQSQ